MGSGDLEVSQSQSQAAAWAKLSFGRRAPGIRVLESEMGWGGFPDAIAVTTDCAQHLGVCPSQNSSRNTGHWVQWAVTHRTQEM